MMLCALTMPNKEKDYSPLRENSAIAAVNEHFPTGCLADASSFIRRYGLAFLLAIANIAILGFLYFVARKTCLTSGAGT